MTPPAQTGELLTAEQVMAEIDKVANPEIAKVIREKYAKDGFPQAVYKDLNIEAVTLYRRKGPPNLVAKTPEPEEEIDHDVAKFMEQAEEVLDMLGGGPAAMLAITEAVDRLMAFASTKFNPATVDEESVKTMLDETDPEVLDFETIRLLERDLVPLAVYRHLKVIQNAAMDYELMSNAKRLMMGYKGMPYAGP